MTSKGEHDLQCSVDVQTKIFKQLDPPYEDLFDCVEQRALDILLQPCLQLSMKERLNYKQVNINKNNKHKGCKWKIVKFKSLSGLASIRKSVLERENQLVVSPWKNPEVRWSSIFLRRTYFLHRYFVHPCPSVTTK